MVQQVQRHCQVLGQPWRRHLAGWVHGFFIFLIYHYHLYVTLRQQFITVFFSGFLFFSSTSTIILLLFFSFSFPFGQVLLPSTVHLYLYISLPLSIYLTIIRFQRASTPIDPGQAFAPFSSFFPLFSLFPLAIFRPFRLFRPFPSFLRFSVFFCLPCRIFLFFLFKLF